MDSKGGGFCVDTPNVGCQWSKQELLLVPHEPREMKVRCRLYTKFFSDRVNTVWDVRFVWFFSNKTILFPFNLEKPPMMSCRVVLCVSGKRNGPLKRVLLTRACYGNRWILCSRIAINDRGSSLFPQPCISKYLPEPSPAAAQRVFKHACPYPPSLLGAMSGMQVVNQVLQWWIRVPASEA